MFFLLRYHFLFLAFLVVFTGCGREKKIGEIDRLLEQDELVEARRLLKTELQFFYDDSLYARQLKHRLRHIDRKMLFSIYDSVLYTRQDTAQAIRALNKARKSIQAKDALSQRWYWFDYYERKARLMRNLGRVNWADTLARIVDYPAPEPRQKTDIMFELARYHAGNQEFVKAREWLDKAMRTFGPEQIKGVYGDIYLHYMDGHFSKAESLLNISDDVAYPWSEVRQFLNAHVDSLTLEDRFKLW